MSVDGVHHVEYRCGSCKEWCLVPHSEDRAKYRECRSCFRVPELDRERLDQRITSFLWAHLLAAQITAARASAPSARNSSASLGLAPNTNRPAASDASEDRNPVGTPDRPDPTTSGEPQWRLNDFLITDGGSDE